MSAWWSTPSATLALCVVTGVRALQFKAMSLARPSSLRRARAGVVRIITVVAGH